MANLRNSNLAACGPTGARIRERMALNASQVSIGSQGGSSSGGAAAGVVVAFDFGFIWFWFWFWIGLLWLSFGLAECNPAAFSRLLGLPPIIPFTLFNLQVLLYSNISPSARLCTQTDVLPCWFRRAFNKKNSRKIVATAACSSVVRAPTIRHTSGTPPGSGFSFA